MKPHSEAPCWASAGRSAILHSNRTAFVPLSIADDWQLLPFIVYVQCCSLLCCIALTELLLRGASSSDDG